MAAQGLSAVVEHRRVEPVDRVALEVDDVADHAA
jgi:hypothetical protein